MTGVQTCALPILAAEHAEARLAIPVNPVLRSAARWAAGDDPLVATIKTSPHLVLTDTTTDKETEDGALDAAAG